MTENKAIQIIKREEQWESNASISKAFNTAIQALEEVQQYREIEKRLEDMFGGDLPLSKYVDELEAVLKELDNPQPLHAKILTYEDAEKWEAYKAIGTVEECRDAVERMKPKKPVHPPASLIWYCPNTHCPEDKQYLMSDKYKVCPDCGQKLDWGEEE